MPRSLSVAEMLRLGKLITKAINVIDIHHFNMMEMAWSGKAKPVKFNIKREPFGSGKFEGSTWIVK